MQYSKSKYFWKKYKLTIYTEDSVPDSYPFWTLVKT